MISIERLFSMTAQGTISIEPSSKGLTSFSKEDALGVLGQVQGKSPIGLKVLEARIAGDEGSANQLRKALKLLLTKNEVTESIAGGLAELAVLEVCGSTRCPVCNGVGQRYSKKFQSIYECSRCVGTGKILMTTSMLAKMLSGYSGIHIAEKVFCKKYYDLYMDTVDQLHTAEGKAAYFAKKILRDIDNEA